MGDSESFHTTSTDKRNRLVIDHKAMREIMQRDEIQYDNGVDFYVDDPRAMQKLIIWLIVGCVLVSAGILTLILSMWIKQRRHETGILLAVGITKGRIVFQYIVEIFMIAVLAFGLSYVASSLVSQGISDLIFHRVAESQEAPEIEVPDDGSEYLDITGQYIPYDTSELETVESVQVNVRPSDLLYIYIFGALLIAVSVSVASITVIQMKPRKILSQMD